MASDKPNLGSKISLLAKAEISCGVIDATDSTVELAKESIGPSGEPGNPQSKLQSLFLEAPEKFKGGLNVMLLGESGHGKSTIAGQLMLAGNASIDKGKSFSKCDDSIKKIWSPSWLKSKWSKEKLLGKTLELKVLPCGLKTNIIDAPGDPNHLKETARGIWMGNLFVMVLSAKDGENEKFFREAGHAKQLERWARFVSDNREIGFIFAVTKMDEINWSETRFMELKERLTQFLPNRNSCEVVPVSGEGGYNVWRRCEESTWYNGKTLVECIRELSKHLPRKYKSSYRSARDRHFSRFVVTSRDRNEVLGKVAEGVVSRKPTYMLLPDEECVEVRDIQSNGHQVHEAGPEEIVMLKLRFGKNEEENVIREGSVTSYTWRPCPAFVEYQAELNIDGICEGSIISDNRRPCRAFVKFEAKIEVVEGIVEENNIYTIHSNAWHSFVRVRGISLLDGTPQASVTVGQKAKATIHCWNQIYLEHVELFERLSKLVLTAEGRAVAFGEVIDQKVLRPE